MPSLDDFRLPAVLLALLLVTGCGESGPSDPLGEDCYMTARIDGDAFCGVFFDVQRSGTQVFVNAGGAGARAIGFTFPDEGAGTYTVAPGNLVAAGVTIGTSNFSAGQDMGSGTIVLTTLTGTRVAGTFQLTVVGASTVNVTQGVFDSDR